MNIDQVEFCTYCIGNVAKELKISQRLAYTKLKESGILTDYIVKCYEVLHTYGRRYIVEDIIELMKERKAI